MIPAHKPRDPIEGRPLSPSTPEKGQEVRCGWQKRVFYVMGYSDDAAGVLVANRIEGTKRIDLRAFYREDAQGRELGPRWDVRTRSWLLPHVEPAPPERTADGL